MTFVVAATILASAFEIEIAPARTLRVPSPAELRIVCRHDKDIHGCTEFLGETLTCECGLHGNEWRIRARAQLIPYVYLEKNRPMVLKHEKLHIEDLRNQIDAHLANVTKRAYPDRESCAAAATFETATFPLPMDLFRRLSNRRLH